MQKSAVPVLSASRLCDLRDGPQLVVSGGRLSTIRIVSSETVIIRLKSSMM